MSVIDKTSLGTTLDHLHLVLLRGEKLSQSERDEIARWIASRVGVTGSYRGLPAPTPADYRQPPRLFTGEIIGSRAGTGCKLGFEATWALTVLHPRQAASAAAAATCRQTTVDLFAHERARRPGMYCCFSCSNAGWRALGVTDTIEAEKLLGAGLARLRAHRDGKGRWSGFPFWYTLLALQALNHPRALEEIRYAAPVLERSLHWKPNDDHHQQHRRLLAERVLAQI